MLFDRIYYHFFSSFFSRSFHSCVFVVPNINTSIGQQNRVSSNEKKSNGKTRARKKMIKDQNDNFKSDLKLKLEGEIRT